nr:MAG TPA: hypothetical protein [Caudoviricetes sp.]
MYEFTATVDRMKTLFIGICQARNDRHDVPICSGVRRAF